MQGMHHLFMVDLPVFVITFALISSTPGDTRPCEGGNLWWAEAMLWCKGLLMAWGAISMITQLLLTGHCGTSVDGFQEGSDGSLEVETVASVLRSTAGSLRLTSNLREQRTSDWVQGGGETPSDAVNRRSASGVVLAGSE